MVRRKDMACSFYCNRNPKSYIPSCIMGHSTSTWTTFYPIWTFSPLEWTTVTKKFPVSSNGWKERLKRNFYSLGYYCTPNLSIHQNSTQELTWNFLVTLEWTCLQAWTFYIYPPLCPRGQKPPLFSFEPKNERTYFLISALASENGSNQKSEGTLLY